MMTLGTEIERTDSVTASYVMTGYTDNVIMTG